MTTQPLGMVDCACCHEVVGAEDVVSNGCWSVCLDCVHGLRRANRMGTTFAPEVRIAGGLRPQTWMMPLVAAMARS